MPPIRRTGIALAALGMLALSAPAGAVAGTYTFSIPQSAIVLGGFEQNHAGVFRLVAPSLIATQTTALPAYLAGDFARAWLSLPGGAAFTQLAGTWNLGSLNVNTNGALTGSVLVRSGVGTISAASSRVITPNYPAFTWSYDGSATRPAAVGVQLAATVAGACGACGTELTTLSGVVDDGQVPSSVTIASALAGKPTQDRAVPIAWSVTDVAAGPGSVYLAINGQRQATPILTAPAADASRLTGQRTGGLATISGSGPVTLPDQDGVYTLQVVGADGVGNETTSAGIQVTLDRQAPAIEASAPTVWCTAPCPVTIHATDAVTGLASVTASVAGAPVALAPPAGEHDRTWSIDAATLGVQGAVVLHVTVTDAAGNARSQDVPLRVDTQLPGLTAPSADPLSRTVTLDVAETSGVATATVRIGTRIVDLDPAGPAQSGVQTLTAAIPIDGFPGALDGVEAAVVVTDQAGNKATTTVGFRAREAPTFRADVRVKRVTYGRSIRVTGTISAASLSGDVPLVVTLENPNWPTYRRTWTVTAQAGSFAITMPPQMSGTLRVAYAGSSEVRASTITIGRISVVPKITARFRVSGGHIVVSGTFSPRSGPPVVLQWQARSPRGGGWLNVCRDQDALRVQAGRFAGRCGVRLNPSLQFRVVYRPGVGGAYTSGASAARQAG